MKKHIVVIMLMVAVMLLTACEVKPPSSEATDETPTIVEPEKPSEVEPISDKIPAQIEEPAAVEKIMRVFTFGDVQAEVGHDAEYKIYVSFEPNAKDKRIFIKQSDDAECEWITHDTVKGEPMTTIYDSVTGKELYLLRFLYVGAPYHGNDLFILDADPATLVHKLSRTADAIETSATLTKNHDDGYYISIPEYGLKRQMEFGGYLGDGWLRELRGNSDWNTFTIDVPILTKNIDEVIITDKTIATVRVVFTNNDKWIPDFYFQTTYEIQNGILTPVKYDLKSLEEVFKIS